MPQRIQEAPEVYYPGDFPGVDEEGLGVASAHEPELSAWEHREILRNIELADAEVPGGGSLLGSLLDDTGMNNRVAIGGDTQKAEGTGREDISLPSVLQMGGGGSAPSRGGG